MKIPGRCLLFFLMVLAAAAGRAQDTAKPAPVYGWKHGLVAGLTLTQMAFTDWAQGGENALAFAINADGRSMEDEVGFSWDNVYKFAFGQTRVGNQGLRKTDDVIEFASVYTYKVGTYINPYASATFKSQFATGYQYDSQGAETPVSKFFDPAYMTQSAGLGYQPTKEVKTRLGAAVREIFTSDFTRYADDPATTEIEKTAVAGGLESVTDVEMSLDNNILFTSHLELFAPIKQLDEIVVRSSTAITGKVNKYLSAIFSLQLINERRITPRTQVKESIALGLSYTIF